MNIPGHHRCRALSWALGLGLVLFAGCRSAAPMAQQVDPTPTQTATAAPSPTATLTATPSPTATATATPTPTPTNTATLTATATPAPTLTITPAAPPATATPATQGGAAPTRAPATAPARTATPARTVTPRPPRTAVPPDVRYRIGGIDFANSSQPLSIAYPASLDGDGLTRFDNLEILVADVRGLQYQRFSTEYGGTVFVYPDNASGSFVLNVHDGVVSRTGRVLEAEPLRQLIEGSLRNPRPLREIEARLERLLGREFFFSQAGVTARFRLVRARRMGAADVAYYQDKASLLSEFVAPFPDPRRAFILFFCSGRQPGEPNTAFPGRYVFVLELAD